MVQPKLPPVDSDDLDPSDDEMTKTNTLEKRMKEVSIDPMHPRFFGKSSSVMFLHTAMALKNTYSGNKETAAVGPDGQRKIVPTKRPEYWRAHSVSPSIIVVLEVAMLMRIPHVLSGSWSLWKVPDRTQRTAFPPRTSCTTS